MTKALAGELLASTPRGAVGGIIKVLVVLLQRALKNLPVRLPRRLDTKRVIVDAADARKDRDRRRGKTHMLSRKRHSVRMRIFGHQGHRPAAAAAADQT